MYRPVHVPCCNIVVPIGYCTGTHLVPIWYPSGTLFGTRRVPVGYSHKLYHLYCMDLYSYCTYSTGTSTVRTCTVRIDLYCTSTVRTSHIPVYWCEYSSTYLCTVQVQYLYGTHLPYPVYTGILVRVQYSYRTCTCTHTVRTCTSCPCICSLIL